MIWHDGVPLSAEDFVFAARVYQTPAFGAASSPLLAPMGDVTAPDPTTLVIQWRQPYPEAAALDVEFQALPRHILEQPFQHLDPQSFARLPFWTGDYVGLGPYRVERSGWNNAEFDRLWKAYAKTLDPAERVTQVVQLERIFTEEVPAIPHFFSPAATAYVAALDGPVTAMTPDAGRGIHRVWEWR